MALNMGTKIATRRLALGLTQRQLADKLGVTDKAVSKWERDQGYPDITILNDLAAVLHMNVADLLTNTDHPAPQTSDDAASDGGNPPQTAPVPDATAPGGTSAARTHKRFTLPHPNIRRLLKLPHITIGHVTTRHVTIGQVAGRLAALWRQITTIMCLTAIVTCLIVDLAVNRRLTWSWIVVAAVIAGWAVVMPLQPFSRRRVLMSTLILTVATPALLAVIHTSMRLPPSTFWAIAWPATLLGAACLWILVLLWFFTKVALVYKIALTLAFAAVSNFVISGAVARVLAERFPDTSAYINVASMGFAAVIVAIIGATLKSHHKVAPSGVRSTAM